MKTKSKGGVPAWPADKYLNIWVCNLGGGLLGYAQFPGGPARTDGVVILHTAFGTEGTAKPPFEHQEDPSQDHEYTDWEALEQLAEEFAALLTD